MKKEDLEKYILEFDPFLSSAVFIADEIQTGFSPYEKSKSDALLKRKFQEKELRDDLEDALEPFHSSGIINAKVMKRIRDLCILNVLYKSSFKNKQNIQKFKLRGRAFELVVESILEWKLKENSDCDFEFVDWGGFDYVIYGKKNHDWLAGIQAKFTFSSGYLDYQKVLEKNRKITSFFKNRKKILFCGGVTKNKKDLVRSAFKKEGWEFYFLWDDINVNKIDVSFSEFIETIEMVSV